MNIEQIRRLLADNRLDTLREKMTQLDDLDRQIEALSQQRSEINRDLKEMLGTLGPTQHSGAGRLPSRSRRSGIRENVLDAIRQTPGMSSSEIRRALGIAPGDKSGSRSVSNALLALKKAWQLKQPEPRKYAAA